MFTPWLRSLDYQQESEQYIYFIDYDLKSNTMDLV